MTTTGHPGRWLRGIVLASTMAATGVPALASVEEDLATLEARAEDIGARTARLDGEARPGSYLTEDEAVARFQDLLFMHMIGDEELAAEGFFALVTTGALSDAGLHRDAEWYLAETLYEMGNFQTAAARFLIIVADQEHPFRDDAVRRLLELYATAGFEQAFDSLYEQEIVPGRVKPTGLITYSLAKSFYKRGDYPDAKSYFEAVPEGDGYYGKAQYFLGTIAVVEDDLDTAIPHFISATEGSVETNDHRLLLDQALLALGRIHYHREQYLEASEYYNRVGGDSLYQADKLYEIIWTSIRRERWRDALNNVEIFLLAYPEHRSAALLKLLQGHLNVKLAVWPTALESYEQVILDYAPIIVRFEGLADPGLDPGDTVDEVLQLDESSDLPVYALAMMRDDPELSRAIAVFQSLDRQRRDLDISERIIAELRGILQGSDSTTTFETMRFQAVDYRTESLVQRVALLRAEAEWLSGLNPTTAMQVQALAPSIDELDGSLSDLVRTVDGARGVLATYEQQRSTLQVEAERSTKGLEAQQAERTRVQDALDEDVDLTAAKRAEMTESVKTLDDEISLLVDRVETSGAALATLGVPSVLAHLDPGQSDPIHERLEEVSNAFWDLRPQMPGLLVGDRIDSVHQTFGQSYERLGEVVMFVDRAERSDLGRIRQRFDQEVTEVGAQSDDFTLVRSDAYDASVALTREGFGRLGDFFADSVLKADMGIVDVYWAQKLEVADDIERVKQEKEALMADLEGRFELIRDKMGRE